MDKNEIETLIKCLSEYQKTGFTERMATNPKTRFIARVARNASENAIKSALTHGRSVTVLQGNSIVEVHPDGRTNVIKELERSSVVPKKRVYQL